MDELLALIRRFEGLHLKSYICPAGVPTIGYGATGPGIKLGMRWTREQAEERMIRDAALATWHTIRLCPTLLEDEMKLAAVADFTFNLGAGRLAASTLRRKILMRDWVGAADEFPRWVRSGAMKLPGLVARREAERRLFTGARR